MKKIQTGQALAALQAVQPMLQRPLAFSLALKMRKLVRELSSIAEDVEEERKKLLEQYADKDEDGQPIIEEGRYSLNGNGAAYSGDYLSLMQEEVDVQTILQASAFGDMEVEPAALIALGDLLEE